jgi:hypothetical protein
MKEQKMAVNCNVFPFPKSAARSARIAMLKGFIRERLGEAPADGFRGDPQMVVALMALMRKKWPERYSARPRLTLITGGRSHG